MTTGTKQTSMSIFETLEANKSDTLIYSSEDSLALTSQLLETVLDWKAKTLVYGGSSAVLLARLDQEQFCWKTLQQSLMQAGEERRLLRRLPNWGMSADGELFRLVTQAHPTNAKDGFSWATPTASDAENRSLPDETKIHVTSSGTLKLDTGHKSHIRLSQMIPYYEKKQDWHTLIANDAKKIGDIELKPENGLSAQIRWATLTASDAKGTGQAGSKSHTHDLEKGHLRAQITKDESGYMNPRWCEMLMGFPENWTDID